MNAHWMKKASRGAIWLVGTLLATAASAQTVYRCGNEYTHVPCVQGVAVDAPAGAGAGDRLEAERIVARERRLAREMEEARRRQEAVTPVRAGSFTSALPAKAVAATPHRSATRKHKGARNDFTIASADDDTLFTAKVPVAVRKR